MSGFVATHGRKPRVEGPWMVRFRSGWVSGPFKTAQLRWSDAAGSWDVVAVKRAKEGAEHLTLNPAQAGEMLEAAA